MSHLKQQDWNPEIYNRFRGFRLRPPMDLLGAIGPLPDGDIVDLGCGNGAVGAALAARFPARRIVGIDASPAMLEKARNNPTYTQLDLADITRWEPETRPALIFSNAALQWVDQHVSLMPRLVDQLAKGGVLAVQMPHQNDALSHCSWNSCFEKLFPGRKLDRRPAVLAPEKYHKLMSGFGDFQLWETEYYQQLVGVSDGHPVRLFTQSTYARPFLDVLDGAEQASLIASYEHEIEQAYPRQANGTVLFVFRRLFFTLKLLD